MPAAYDTYDYPSYWIGREYEHRSELVAIKAFLRKIPKLKTIVEVGTGFGRLVSSYKYRAKKTILTDPSGKLLSLARDVYQNKGILFIHSSLENLPKKLRKNTADLIVMIRVIHHINNIDKAFYNLSRLTVKGGYLILEFANKGNFKNVYKEFLKGNFVFPMEFETVDKRSKKNQKRKTIPFNNFHSDYMTEMLKKYGYEIIEKRSVSNARGSFLRKIFPTNFFISLADIFQPILGYINFGPSIFILAKKVSEPTQP
jgi:ubiquinone/menaquinone biosynthesis C-methylase UbiE